MLNVYLQDMTTKFLRAGKTVKITFTKKDGSERVLRGCINPELIPAEKHGTGKGVVRTPEVQSIFDLDAGEWRSFRWDSLKGVEEV